MFSSKFFENFAEVEHYQGRGQGIPTDKPTDMDKGMELDNGTNIINTYIETDNEMATEMDQVMDQDMAPDNEIAMDMDTANDIPMDTDTYTDTDRRQLKAALLEKQKKKQKQNLIPYKAQSLCDKVTELANECLKKQKADVMENFQSGAETASDMNLFLRGALYACLFYLLSHQDTLRFVSKHIKQLNMANAHLAMAAVFVLCYVLLTKYL